ncbi:hypothetical protein DMENIID0001_042220 [Sergentomyia squamirostris]
MMEKDRGSPSWIEASIKELSATDSLVLACVLAVVAAKPGALLAYSGAPALYTAPAYSAAAPLSYPYASPYAYNYAYSRPLTYAAPYGYNSYSYYNNYRAPISSYPYSYIY